ncbi:hypothetical protein TNIN_425681 [Trichonephila inaurata madagascariensis]|uniref:Uncharacterized protein n=1 Tax=Trichonephila inaurata madagascariensis TaxID=2747483 RepID=A0A8X6YRK6_9ARAC|nr:hypothetical protein TNIN_425681 [Trichonephila inaurata madagascariensis]
MSQQQTTHIHPKQMLSPTFNVSLSTFSVFHCVPFCLPSQSQDFPLYSSKIGSSPSFSEAAERLLEPSPNKEIIDSKENGRSTAERKE